MEKNKKVIMVFILIAFVMLIIMLNENNSYRHTIYVNWGIDFCNSKKLEPIFIYDYRKGEDFIIWSYDNDNFNKALSKNNFNLIDTENIKSVEQYLVEFYNRLDSKEKELFDNNVKINLLISSGNYFLYKDKIKDYVDWENRNFVIVIADQETKKIYYFNAIW